MNLSQNQIKKGIAMKFSFISLLLLITMSLGAFTEKTPGPELSDDSRESIISTEVVKSLNSLDTRFDEANSENSSGCDYGTCSCEFIDCTDGGGSNEDCWDGFEVCMCDTHEICEHP